MQSGDWVTVAVLSRIRGNKGELAAVSYTSRPERLQELRRVYLFGDGSEHTVESVWFHGGEPVFKFAGVDTISAAEPLRGAEVRVPFSERTPAGPGEYFLSDLIGCEVFDARTGARLGAVSGCAEPGGQVLLEVGEELLVPLVKEICVSIDPAARRIVVDLPEGLEGLNRP
jgi:16S rRNA processing protein RimM